jgi:hypothetical protein
MDATTLIAALATPLVTLGGGVIAYLVREIAALRRERDALLKAVYQHKEAMQAYEESAGGPRR